jgi:hypothetical protein
MEREILTPLITKPVIWHDSEPPPSASETYLRNVKVKLSLCLTKAYEGVEEQLHISLTLVLHGGVVIFTPLLLHPEEGVPDTHSVRGWMGPMAGLDAGVAEKNPLPLPRNEPRVLTELPRLKSRRSSLCKADFLLCFKHHDMKKHSSMLHRLLR